MCTGNTSSFERNGLRLTVYPCVYREHPTIKIRLPENFGLSLCVQGTPVQPVRSNYHLRFIPVCTGNTYVYCYFSAVRYGLSLCVQGTRFLYESFSSLTRFIPVCTGNTDFLYGALRRMVVYPCVYREHAC